MAGNKTDNGVLEIGSEELVKSYQEDTPGQQLEAYLSTMTEVNHDIQKKHFSTKFPNPLKGYPYQKESLDVAEADKVVCPECKGSGEVDDKECTHCDGSGYHMSEESE